MKDGKSEEFNEFDELFDCSRISTEITRDDQRLLRFKKSFDDSSDDCAAVSRLKAQQKFHGSFEQKSTHLLCSTVSVQWETRPLQVVHPVPYLDPDALP